MSNGNSSDLIHFFHSEYRKSGLALCISLGALAATEGWWFYSFHNQLTKTSQCLIWSGSVLSALTILVISFLVQCLHYFGLRFAARFYASNRDQNSTWLKAWSDSILGIADILVMILFVLLLLNVFFVLWYVVQYTPPVLFKV